MIDLFLEDTLDNLMQIRDAFFEKYTWIYKDSRGIPRDTHLPEVVIQSKTAADYANAYNLWKVQRAYLEQPPAAVINTSQQQQHHLQEELVAMENRSQKRSRRTTSSNPVATALSQNNSKRNTML